MEYVYYYKFPVHRPQDDGIISYSTSDEDDKERIKIFRFAMKIIFRIWINQEHSDGRPVILNGAEIPRSDYYATDIYNAVCVTQILLRGYFKKLFELLKSEDNAFFNKQFEYALIYGWVKNRNDIFVKVIDVLAVIIELVCFRNTDKTSFYDHPAAANYFLYLYEIYLKKEFIERGGWNCLKVKSWNLYANLNVNLSQNYKNLGTFEYKEVELNCSVIECLRTSAVKFPVPAEYICESCEKPTDETEVITFVTFDDDTTDDIKMHFTKTGDKEDFFLLNDKDLRKDFNHFKSLTQENSQKIREYCLNNAIHMRGDILFFSKKLFQSFEFASLYFSELKLPLHEKWRQSSHKFVFVGEKLEMVDISRSVKSEPITSGLQNGVKRINEFIAKETGNNQQTEIIDLELQKTEIIQETESIASATKE